MAGVSRRRRRTTPLRTIQRAFPNLPIRGIITARPRALHRRPPRHRLRGGTRMSARTKPPFRADHVGSFLRPAALLDARERNRKGEISRAQLREVEDASIRDIVRFQEGLGLEGVTDGEFRRTYFHIDFLEQLSGIETKGGIAVSFHSASGNVDFAPPVMHITAPVRHIKPIQVDDFTFLRSVTKRTPKVTIPSPTMLHFRGGREAISREAYPDLEAFFADVAAAYRDELKALGEAGGNYWHLPDPQIPLPCRPRMHAAVPLRQLSCQQP